MSGISIIASFAAGLISFLSPCVAPLVPGYLSLISGVTFTPGNEPRASGRAVFVASLVFVAGFTLVFVALGASASSLGGLLEEHRRWLNRLAGALMVLMGLFVMGALQLPWLYRERRFHPAPGRSLTKSEVLLLGMAFGFGWTPCIGPLLASILVYTSASETVGRGVLLLFAYSLGLGLPFIVVGFGIGRAVGLLRWIVRHYRVVSSVSGATLILVGALFLTDRFFYFSIAVQRFYYQVVEPSVGGRLSG